MYATITLRDALNILKEKYEKEYGNDKEVTVNYYLTSYTHTYTDWGGFTETEKYYVINAEIRFNKIFGSLVAHGCVKKNHKELNKDLTDELKNNYSDDTYNISSVCLPTFKSNKLNYYDEEVNIWITEKRKKLVK